MEPDVLGPPYERQTIDLGRDDEGPVVATLVRRRSSHPSDRAVLYVHGFVDYFFQTHLADFFVERGWHFYALDLRKYGRSLLPHQTPNFCHDLSDYFPDLDAAIQIIREVDGNRTVLVNAHSTGGLITAIWADARRDAGVVDGLFLNSPFFDINAPWLIRRPAVAAVTGLVRGNPYRIIPLRRPQVYGHSLHADLRGEWRYDLAWKPLTGFPVRVGWLAAIRRAQRRLHAGLRIPVPILVASSSRTFRGRSWHDSAARADAVLDVEHIARWAPCLGPHVTLIRLDGGLHDLTLSGPAVRERLFTELDRWVAAHLVPSGAAAGAPASPSAPPQPRAAEAAEVAPAPHPVQPTGRTAAARLDSSSGPRLAPAARPDRAGAPGRPPVPAPARGAVSTTHRAATPADFG